MIIALPHYSKIKNNYCVGYFGQKDEVLLKLLAARPNLENQFPGLQLYICCLDEKAALVGEDKVILKSQLDSGLKQVAYFREISDDALEEFLKENASPA